jgi:hypothetical protein
MATTTNYGWTTPDNTALVKDGASAIRTLGSSIDTTLKAQIDAVIPDNLLTTTGDVIYASAANTPARLGVGTTGQVLTVSGGLPVWATATSGAIVLISETTASALSSLSLSSIPSTYKQLILAWSGIYQSNTTTGFQMRFNNVSTSIYHSAFNGSRGSTYDNSVNSNNRADSDVDNASFGFGCANLDADASRGYVIIDNYASATRFKTYVMNYSNKGPSGGVTRAGTGTFGSTTAITSIDIFRGTGAGTFSNQTNTSIRLYGVL